MEEKRIYYVGIDHGNHLMKTSNHVFENGVERQAVKPTFQTNTLVYDGAFYKIGEKRNSVKDSKLADDDYYLLTLAALAKECQSGNIPNGAGVVLGVGLPLKQFATVRKQFVKYLKRGNQPVHFKFEDVAYDFTIENVLAFPQCYAAVADRLGSMKGEYVTQVMKDIMPNLLNKSTLKCLGCLERIANEVFALETDSAEYKITFTIDTFQNKDARIIIDIVPKYIYEGIEKCYDRYLEKLKIEIKKRMNVDWKRCDWLIDEPSEALCTELYSEFFKLENRIRSFVSRVLTLHFLQK